MRRDAERFDRNRTRLRAARESVYGHYGMGHGALNRAWAALERPAPDGKQLDLFEDYRPPIISMDIETWSRCPMVDGVELNRVWHTTRWPIAITRRDGAVHLYDNMS